MPKRFNRTQWSKKFESIIKKLKAGVSVRELMDSGKFELDMIDRAYEQYQRRSIHGNKKTHAKCSCGAVVVELNILGECLACELRKGKR